MRKVVLQMMTTLNGRLDDPNAWVSGISDELYREIDRLYATYDTVLVGRTTYEEMVGYWPGAANEAGATEAVKGMAHKMNTYKKFVFSHDSKATDWNNSEPVIAHSDADVIEFIHKLKAQAGRDIHVSGGAELAQTFIRLGLVDEYRLFMYPVVSAGMSWLDALEGKPPMELLSATAYPDGVVRLHYVAK